jgi:hypothetical protein
MSIIVPTSFIQQTDPPTYLGFTTGSSIYLNANNRTSYPLSGSVWYDLSGNGRNAAITGSISFVNGGTGSVSYWDLPGGTGSNAMIYANSSFGALAGSVTIGGWCKAYLPSPPTGNTYSYIPLYSYGSSTGGLLGLSSRIWTGPGADQSGTSRIQVPFFNTTGSNAYADTTDGYFWNYRSKWLHMMMQWKYEATQPNPGSNVRLYVNGTLQAWDTERGGISGDRRVRCGNFNAGGSLSTVFYNSSYATLEGYDRFLTSDEIYGNFYVSKSFYGY